MSTLSIRDAVVDQLAEALAERRRNTIGRRAAYLALAQAILMDEPEEREPAFEPARAA